MPNAALPKKLCSIAAILALCLSLSADSATGREKANKPKQLKFGEIQQIARRHFATQPDYQPGDLITQQAAEGVFKQLELYGWKVADQKAIQGQMLSDSDFVVRELRTKRGKHFMRQISQYPGGYDRLDRISTMPQGRGNVAQMIKLPDGYKMIEAMTTTRRGHILGQRLSNAPKGKNFNKPTGKIYTEDAFITRLKESFDNRNKK